MRGGEVNQNCSGKTRDHDSSYLQKREASPFPGREDTVDIPLAPTNMVGHIAQALTKHLKKNLEMMKSRLCVGHAGLCPTYDTSI